MAASDSLREAEEQLAAGELTKALRALARAEVAYKRSKDADGLRAVLKLVILIDPHVSGSDQKFAKRVERLATKNLSLLGQVEPTLPVQNNANALVRTSMPDSLQRGEVLPATPLHTLPQRTRTAVEDGLIPGEPVGVVVKGTGSAAIVGTDRRAFIYKRGLLAGATFGHKLTSFAYENIVGIEVHTGAMSGAVVIHVPGAASVSTSYWQNSKSDPHKAYNAIPIVRPYGPAQAAVAELRALIAQCVRRPTAESTKVETVTPSNNTPDSDPLEVLRRLGDLRDAGVLTTEEFEAKKFELLSRL